jgi:hypothetical protein
VTSHHDPGDSIRAGVFPHRDMEHVGGALSDATVERTKAGAADSRLMDIAREFVGSRPVPLRATAPALG